MKVTGIDEISASLKSVAKVSGDVIESAGLAGSEVIRQEAARLAPRSRGKAGRRGHAADHIICVVEKKTASMVRIAIGPDKAHAWYVNFVERGTRPHIIKPRRKKALRFFTGDGETHAMVVNHPGIVARPFMRPALDHKEAEAQKAFANRVRAAVFGKVAAGAVKRAVR